MTEAKHTQPSESEAAASEGASAQSRYYCSTTSSRAETVTPVNGDSDISFLYVRSGTISLAFGGTVHYIAPT